MLLTCPQCSAQFPQVQSKKYKEKTIIVEGGDDEILIQHLMTKIGITDYVIENKGGYPKLVDSLKNIDANSGYNDIKKILILVDADNRAPSYKLSDIKRALRGKGFTSPKSLRNISSSRKNKKQIGIFIFPNNRNKGVLEDLCLKALVHPQKIKCIEKHIECIEKKGLLATSKVKLPKSKIHIYMSTSSNPTGNVGGAVFSNEIDLNNHVFDSLISFLEQLR